MGGVPAEFRGANSFPAPPQDLLTEDEFAPALKTYMMDNEVRPPMSAMTGQVGHFEIPADDPARARKFYAAAFGWNYTEMPEMEYSMVTTGPVDDKGMPKEPGYIGGGIGKRGGPLAHPVVTIMVEDVAAAEKAVEKHGGKIVQRKQPIGDGSMGFTAYFKDTEGNVVGLYEWPKM